MKPGMARNSEYFPKDELIELVDSSNSITDASYSRVVPFSFVRTDISFVPFVVLFYVEWLK